MIAVVEKALQNNITVDICRSVFTGHYYYVVHLLLFTGFFYTNNQIPQTTYIDGQDSSAVAIHKMTMTSFAITLCCQCHIVGQQIVSDISVVRSCWTICSLCSECNNTNLLLPLVFAVLGMSILLHIPNILCPTIWRHALGWPQTENSVTSLHLIYGACFTWNYSWHQRRPTLKPKVL